MIKIENAEVMGWEAALRGMRNPLNSWEKSDSKWCSIETPGTNPAAANDRYLREKYYIGNNDLDLMTRLRKAGTDHRKFMRMITVYVDITAPLYWWKEFDTYKVGTIANSCSTMHKIADKKFTIDDFSCEHLVTPAKEHIEDTIEALNAYRDMYLDFDQEASTVKRAFDYDSKNVWWQMIQLLPSSYNQKRTVMLNYEVLANMYKSRKDHKLDEWRTLCEWMKTLPYSELITGEDRIVDAINEIGNVNPITADEIRKGEIKNG